jgi:hypothetical protein
MAVVVGPKMKDLGPILWQRRNRRHLRPTRTGTLKTEALLPKQTMQQQLQVQCLHLRRTTILAATAAEVALAAVSDVTTMDIMAATTALAAVRPYTHLGQPLPGTVTTTSLIWTLT